MCSIIIGHKNWWGYGHPNWLGKKNCGVIGTSDNQYPTGMYIAKKNLFQKKEEANEIKYSQNNHFLFNISEYIYILWFWQRMNVSPKYFSNIILVPWGMISLDNATKIIISEIVKTPRREASQKT